jgi:hypothetical protein
MDIPLCSLPFKVVFLENFAASAEVMFPNSVALFLY